MPVGHVGETVGVRRRGSKLTASCKVQNFSISLRCVLKVSFISNHSSARKLHLPKVLLVLSYICTILLQLAGEI